VLTNNLAGAYAECTIDHPMGTSEFYPGSFLRYVYGTEPFVRYCRERRIPFEQVPNGLPQEDDFRRWAVACTGLPRETQVRVDLELTRVHDMAQGDALQYLIEAADGRLPSDRVAGDAPLALWFYLHRRAAFEEAFLRREFRNADSWRTARGPAGIHLTDPREKAAALARSLRAFFRVREGAGRFCVVDAYPRPASVVFAVQVAERLRTFEGFADTGELTLHRFRPARRVFFVYQPADGIILIRSHLRARQRLVELVQRFGWAVLHANIGDDCLVDTFDLNMLKREFSPLPDDPDMQTVRVKSLHLRYPARAGRRQVKLETLASDGPDAIRELIDAHAGDGARFEQLLVSHAELQVTFRVHGRSQSHIIRLWPNRSNLPQTSTGDRLRSCLRRWGLCHAPQP
jgi:hypothetical protein